MKGKLALLLLGLLLVGPTLEAAPLGTAISYQGRLDDSGSPANGTYSFRYRLLGDPSGTTQIGPVVDLPSQPIAGGLLNAPLDFGPTAFNGDARWLEISVKPGSPSDAGDYITLNPQPLPPAGSSQFARLAGDVLNGVITGQKLAPLAVTTTHISDGAITGPKLGDGQVVKSFNGLQDHVTLAAGANVTITPSGNTLTVSATGAGGSSGWSLTGNATTSGQFIGTLGSQPFEVRVNNSRALLIEPNATSPNMVGGFQGNFVTSGIKGATIAGGGALNWFGAAPPNQVGGDYGTVGGGVGNVAGGPVSTISGGERGAIAPDAHNSTISGGAFNVIAAPRAVIGGGTNNFIEVGAEGSVIAGGWNNMAVGQGSTIGGGRLNQLLGAFDFRTIAGGVGNAIVGDAAWSTIGGGANNEIWARRAVIAGGSNNVIEAGATGSFIAAGRNNRILNSGTSSVVAGFDNTNAAGNAVIAGGYLNTAGANSAAATIGGGAENSIGANAPSSLIAGGSRNAIRDGALVGAILGGLRNTIGANAQVATVAGGQDNFVGGNYGLAAGRRARALHQGSWVWGDSTDADVASSGPNQFLIRAAGGVGIGTSDPAGAALRVAGTVRADGFNGPLPASQLTGTLAPANLSSTAPSAGQVLSYNGSSLVWQSPGGASGAWVVGGNNASAGNFVGTLNNVPLELKANNSRALLLEPNVTSPNLIGGWSGNVVNPGVFGATIGGGGAALQFSQSASNRVTDHFGTIAGGAHNLAGNTNVSLTDAYFATVGGGHFNSAKGVSSTIAGGANNTVSANDSTIGGGYLNTVNGGQSVVGGGYNNLAEGLGSTIAGGLGNSLSGASDARTIGGGQNNSILNGGSWSVIGGGLNNIITAQQAVIVGGTNNQIEASADRSFIAAGRNNRVLNGATGSFIAGSANTNGAPAGAIGGGSLNRIDANADLAIIDGGAGNVVSAGAQAATIGGGQFNLIGQGASAAVIAGGQGHIVGSGARFSAIGGGNENAIGATAEFAAIGGGVNNEIRDGAFKSTIGGGDGNTISNGLFDATIAGGALNTIAGDGRFGSIGGGAFNYVANDSGTIAGGSQNTNLADSAAIGGGFQNGIEPQAGASVIAGGTDNRIATGSFDSTISGGSGNRIQDGTYITVGGGFGNIGAGNYSTVAGGAGNLAGGDYSFAAGRNAVASELGTFVWADSNPFDFYSTANNSVRFRCTGGFEIVTGIDAFGDTLSGVRIAAGSGSWTSISDRHAKDNVRPVNVREVLEKVARLPLSTWNYKAQPPEIRHVGPMAQDFHEAFQVGETNTGISVVDADGVALAAIQGLHQIVQEQAAALAASKEENAALKVKLAALQTQLAAHAHTLTRWESRLAALERAVEGSSDLQSGTTSDRGNAATLSGKNVVLMAPVGAAAIQQ
jgi:hypothetical protein